MKTTLLFIMIFAVSAWAGMLEFTDNDPRQEFEFICDSSVHDSVRVWFKIAETDSFLTFTTVIPPNIVYSYEFNYIVSDRDSNNYIIPGHYEGEYWFYEETFIINGGTILGEDTTHVYVNYDQPPGCSPLRRID